MRSFGRRVKNAEAHLGRGKKRRLVAASEKPEIKSADCSMPSAEIDHLQFLLREVKSVQMEKLRC